MKIIGITGGIGAGKSTVSNEFARLGATVIDADKIAKEVLKKNGLAYAEAISAFGNDILLENGEINRKKLAEIVFSDKAKLNRLNEITHKHIFIKMQEEIDRAKTEVVVLDVPLLFSADFAIECDIKIAVLADENVRICRVENRDKVTAEQVKARIKNQLTDEEYREMADICIINNDFDDTKRQIEKIYESVR